TISPIPNRIFTTSATDRPHLSAIVCALEPRTTLSAGKAGRGGAGGAAAASGGAGAGAGGGAASPSPETSATTAGPGAGAVSARAGAGAAATASSVAGFGFGFGLGVGASTTSFTLAPGTALPPLARRRGTASSGTEEEAVRPSIPISSSAASRSLLVTPSSFASSWTLTASLPARCRPLA